MSRSRRSKTYIPSRGRLAGRAFGSRGEYGKALKATKPRRASKAIRSLKDLKALPIAEQEKRSDALEVLGLMRREGLTLAKAVRHVRSEDPFSKISERSVHKYAGPALYKQKRTGQWKARKSDKLLRTMPFPTRGGVVQLEVRNSKVASQIGTYWNAVKVYLETGDKRGLRQFRGKALRVGQEDYRFVTAPKALERLADFGPIDFDEGYERGASRRT